MMLRCGKLAKTARISRMQVWRLAKAGEIPGARKSKGNHFFFVKSPALTKWAKERAHQRREQLRRGGRRLRRRARREAKPEFPFDLSGLNSVARALNVFDRHPLDTWPEPSRKRLRELLEPVARKLWPERFSQGPGGA